MGDERPPSEPIVQRGNAVRKHIGTRLPGDHPARRNDPFIGIERAQHLVRVPPRVELHRTDAKHCQFYDKQSRYGGQAQQLEQLPFPVRDIALNRYQLCDYCFFGGPDKLRAAL